MLRVVYIADEVVVSKPERETTHMRCIALVKKLEADDLIKARKEYAKEIKEAGEYQSPAKITNVPAIITDYENKSKEK